MSTLEQRVQIIEDRAALENVLLQYYAAVDSMSDLDSLVDCFTPDAIFDVSDLGLDTCQGHDAIRKFFTGVFADTRHHCHHVTNFQIRKLEENTAMARGYVFARAIGAKDQQVLVYCCYDIDYVRTAAGWKITRFDEDALIPLGEDVAQLHERA
ncbi:MAG: nuclear transport factor 2 family protein [Sphingomonadaceae bacterium]